MRLLGSGVYGLSLLQGASDGLLQLAVLVSAASDRTPRVDLIQHHQLGGGRRGAGGRSGSSNSDRLLGDGPVLFHSGGRVTSSPTNSLSERNLGMPTLARIFPDSSSRKTYRFSCRISVRGSWLSLVVTRHSVCRQC